MKKFNVLMVLVMMIFSLGFVNAQAPQGVNYQGVATDVSGNVLSNQAVKVKLTILNESASGAESWVETHEVNTDEFGLFCLVLGEGNRIGGIATVFSDVSWGSSEKFLQIEIDVAGGDDFALLGTNKIMSVPYALETAMADEVRNERQTLNFDSATGELTLVTPNGTNSIVNVKQNLNYNGETGELELKDVDGNITSVVNFNSGKFGAPGSSFDYPNGLLGDYGFLGTEQFQVPAGKVMFLTNADAEVTIVNALDIFPEFVHTTVPNMPMFPAGTKLKDCNCSYFLTDELPGVTAKLIDLTATTSTYVVPDSMALFIKSGLDGDDPIELSLDGIEYKFLKPNETRGTRIITVPSGVLIGKAAADMDHPRILSGYLLEY